MKALISNNPMTKPDLVIIGGGIAGMTVALRARELGLEVLILEKGVGLYPCNTRYTGGAFHICFHNIEDDPKTLQNAIIETTGGFADTELAEAVSTDAAAAVNWLRQQGIRTIKVGPDPWRQNFLSPPGLMRAGLHWQGRGGDFMLRTLRTRFEALGGQMRCGVRATRLYMEEGHIAGVHIECDGVSDVVRAHRVVLCDGGFQANLGLMREFVSPAPEKLKQRGAATGNGDGLQMALEVGAAIRGTNNIYGHIVSRQAMIDDALWPYPILDYVCAAAIVVEPSGKRFMDEGLGGVYMVNRIAQLADPLSTTVIFDQAIWKGPATEFILPSNPYLPLAGGQVIAAATLEELACNTGISSSGLIETVGKYNAAIDAKKTADLSPGRSSRKSRPWPIRQAPFYAVHLAAGVTYTMGGIATDAYGRVLRDDNQIIDGLYASGCSTGGLEGGDNAGYIGGLIKSLVMSRRVADAIAVDSKMMWSPKVVDATA